ncbi:MAG: hypothetical protein C0498_01250 [Anaerolinea sp.]|nr:hypothetical protein [Anaerolinea sp.]
MAAYRERHVIRPIGQDGREWPLPAEPVCATDRIRVIERRGGWRHDPDEVRRLARADASVIWR